LSPREVLKEFYRLKIGSGFLREARELEEFFTFLLLAEFFGLSAPYKLLFAELTPELLEAFHAWHRRAGFKTSPLEYLPCC